MIEEKDIKRLIRSAFEGQERSYSPYSKYRVGAAILTADGRIFTGCNIENAAFTPGDCAERTAVCKAVSEGCKDFEAIAVVGGAKGKAPDMAYPCGVCRQILREFVEPDKFEVIVARSESDYEKYTLEELLPKSFGPANLG